ncbi:MAG: DUF1631 family protein [Pseudomonadota bacterium]
MLDLPARLDALLIQADTLLTGLQRTPQQALLWHQRWLTAALRRWLQQQADLSEPVRQALSVLPERLAMALSQSARPWLQQVIAMRQLGELAVSTLRGFDAFSGRRSDSLPTQIAALLQAANDNASADQACLRLGELLRQHAADIRPLEQQLVNKERQQRQQTDAARGVARLLQLRLADVMLPQFALPFFDQELRKLLQILHLQHGEASTHWAQAMTALDSLIWALTETDLDALRAAYDGRIQQAVGHLREQFSNIQHNAEALDDFFNAFDFYLLSRFAGQQPAISVEPWQDHQDTDNSWARTDDALLKARALRVGDWVELTLEPGRVRARLLDKDLSRGIYLFSNLSGLRVGRFTTAELTERFNQQQIRVIDSRPVLLAALPTVIEELENELLQLQLDSQHLVEQQRQQEAERLQRQLERERAEQAAAQAREDAAREAQARVEAKARLLAECLQACRRLQAGAWIELRQDDSPLQAQLAVILNRTGELVFVDRQGRKLLQATPEQLAEQVADASIRILDYGRALDDTLQQMVAEQRQKKEAWQG